jgi:HSP20 family protein
MICPCAGSTVCPGRHKNGEGSTPDRLTEWLSPVDIEENDREYVVKAELPGMKKEEVKLKVEGGTLLISGERKAEKKEKDKKYHRLERSYGAFQRSFTLPEGRSA